MSKLSSRRSFVKRTQPANYKPSAAFLQTFEKLYAVAFPDRTGELLATEVVNRQQARQLARDWNRKAGNRGTRAIVREIKLQLAG